MVRSLHGSIDEAFFLLDSYAYEKSRYPVFIIFFPQFNTFQDKTRNRAGHDGVGD